MVGRGLDADGKGVMLSAGEGVEWWTETGAVGV